MFPYDAQEGTPAATLPGQVPPALAFERAARLGEVIDDGRRRVLGRARRAAVDVLIERGTRTRRRRRAVGALPVQAPDIDGRTWCAAPVAARAARRTPSSTGSVGYDVEAVAGSREP